MSTVSSGKRQPDTATGWTDDRVQLLAERWNAGFSAGQVAKSLNVTRNAAIGKLKRLGLLGASPTDKPPAQRAKPGMRDGTKMITIKAKPCPSPESKPLTEAPSNGQGISLYDLTNTTCRWPKGTPGEADFCFCGRSGADMNASRPYCAEHTRKAIKQ